MKTYIINGSEVSRLSVAIQWGNHFWSRGYFVDTVGVNEEIIRRYVRHQEKMVTMPPLQGTFSKATFLEGGLLLTLSA